MFVSVSAVYQTPIRISVSTDDGAFDALADVANTLLQQFFAYRSSAHDATYDVLHLELVPMTASNGTTQGSRRLQAAIGTADVSTCSSSLSTFEISLWTTDLDAAALFAAAFLQQPATLDDVMDSLDPTNATRCGNQTVQIMSQTTQWSSPSVSSQPSPSPTLASPPLFPPSAPFSILPWGVASISQAASGGFDWIAVSAIVASSAIMLGVIIFCRCRPRRNHLSKTPVLLAPSPQLVAPPETPSMVKLATTHDCQCSQDASTDPDVLKPLASLLAEPTARVATPVPSPESANGSLKDEPPHYAAGLLDTSQPLRRAPALSAFGPPRRRAPVLPSLTATGNAVRAVSRLGELPMTHPRILPRAMAAPVAAPEPAPVVGSELGAEPEDRASAGAPEPTLLLALPPPRSLQPQTLQPVPFGPHRMIRPSVVARSVEQQQAYWQHRQRPTRPAMIGPAAQPPPAVPAVAPKAPGRPTVQDLEEVAQKAEAEVRRRCTYVRLDVAKRRIVMLAPIEFHGSKHKAGVAAYKDVVRAEKIISECMLALQLCNDLLARRNLSPLAVQFEGHTSTSLHGEEESLAISSRRAQVCAESLIRRMKADPSRDSALRSSFWGVPANELISSVGFGSTQPLPGYTDGGNYAENRRVEIRLREPPMPASTPSPDAWEAPILQPPSRSPEQMMARRIRLVRAALSLQPTPAHLRSIMNCILSDVPISGGGGGGGGIRVQPIHLNAVLNDL